MYGKNLVGKRELILYALIDSRLITLKGSDVETSYQYQDNKKIKHTHNQLNPASKTQFKEIFVQIFFLFERKYCTKKEFTYIYF